ncbi:MAG: hypothetical protein GY822_05705 [Deltaproteobacteria bacterium]|nr:hypothetical protein [Deltaproteobacteria bacterium]
MNKFTKGVMVVFLSSTFLTACGTTRESKFEAAPTDTAAATTEPTDGSAALLTDAEGLWAERSDQAKLEAAIAKWEEAAKTTADADLYLKLSRGHYFLGDGFYALQGDAEKRDAHYTIGLDWAEKALGLQAPDFVAALKGGAKHPEAILKAPPEAVPSMYWYATNLGKWAASKGFATKLKYKDNIKATMLHVKSLDEKFFYAAPFRYFGAFEAATAGIAGGSLELSEKNFKKAVEMNPEYLGTKVLWADYLAKKQNNRELYEQLLKEVIEANAAVDPAIEPENKQEQAKAKKLLANIDDVF